MLGGCHSLDLGGRPIDSALKINPIVIGNECLLALAAVSNFQIKPSLWRETDIPVPIRISPTPSSRNRQYDLDFLQPIESFLNKFRACVETNKISTTHVMRKVKMDWLIDFTVPIWKILISLGSPIETVGHCSNTV